MIFLVSGEGPTDIGTCINGHEECSETDFCPGSMSIILDKLVEPITSYSLLDAGAIEFVSKHLINSRSLKLPRSLFVGKKRDYEAGFFFKNARALACLAKDKSISLETPVGAVLFRDADGTRSTERGLFETKWKSIEDGFNAEDFENGVPMVPKPKSEAWLLCALKTQPYQTCAPLENSLSGNDTCPNPAKEQLEAILCSRGKTVDDLPDMVKDGTISPTRIDMPSFNRFRERLETVTRKMLNRSSPTTGI